MFKWKVTGLGGSKKKTNGTSAKLNNATIELSKNNKNKEHAQQTSHKKDKKTIETSHNNNNKDSLDVVSSSRLRSLFLNSNSQVSKDEQRNEELDGGETLDFRYRIGQRLAEANGTDRTVECKVGAEPGMAPPVPPNKPGWRPGRQRLQDSSLPFLPNDSLYGSSSREEKVELAHWSSHGYLAKSNETEPSSYVHSKKPSRPKIPILENEGDRKYFSVRGFSDLQVKDKDKYYSVDERYQNKYLPTDARLKLKETVRINSVENHRSTSVHPPYPQPPPPPPRPQEKVANRNNLGGSVSWSEWTQQLEAYIAWVNSQLRKKPNLIPVLDLRTDLQSGEVLAQLIEIVSGETISGIQYKPESLQGMKDNLDRILQFMISKRIRMHQITSKEILEGNLKAVMRLILALAAYYKPQSVRHHEVAIYDKENVLTHDQSMTNTSLTQTTGLETPLNQTQESIIDDSSFYLPASSSVKRTQSLNESHMSVESPSSKLYENYNSEKDSCETSVMGTQTIVSALRPKKENNFVRSGSGRKLPDIPPEESDAIKAENRKSKPPKALEFWESMENIEKDSDFRYNTIHRISVGRRILPKPPPSSSSESCPSLRPQNDDFDDSFSEPLSLPNHSSKGSESLSPEHLRKKIPADGCSLQSNGSSGDSQHPTSDSSETRGEIEGSSDKDSSPPTSVIQDSLSNNWNSCSRPSNCSKTSRDFIMENESNTHSYSSKYYKEAARKGDGEQSGRNHIPYEVLLQDLNQAKVQLLELHTLECASLENSKLSLQSRLAEQETSLSQLKQNLVRTTLMKQNLEFEKKELVRRIEELENELSISKRSTENNDQTIRSLKNQVEELMNSKDYLSELECKTLYDEELSVAKDAIYNLRTSFNEADPNQHILDTLEQCISIIIERIQCYDGSGKHGYKLPIHQQQQPPLSSLLLNTTQRLNSSEIISASTKILYFTNRSVTPFMTTVPKKIGEITLRDFKTLFERSGHYRYHFKTVDAEFGMVKEEITNEDSVLPGSDGKIVAWIDED